ncbi:MAG: hypothetical protein CL681_14820 [Blastopirellula sp.]|nr:hypothetical protein [Blastopirellula sp.]
MALETRCATLADRRQRRLAWFRRGWAASCLALMVVTWKLWTPQTVFPQVPLLAIGLYLPAWLDWLACTVAVGSLVGLLVLRSRRGVTVAGGLFSAAMLLLVLADQHRLQPWAYQSMILAVVFATCSAADGLRWLRMLVISIYIFSAIGKFDYEFLHTLGQQFLSTLAGLCHLPDQFWSPTFRLALAALFPLGELLIGLGLSWRRTRRFAVGVAVAMHGLLLLVLGPWGLNHQAGVLLWNVFFVFQAVLLFWPIRPPAADASEAALPPRTRWSLLGKCVVSAAVILPCFEWFDRYDHWLAWGLYSPRNSRVLCFLDEQLADQLPEPLRQHLQVSQEDLAILRLRIDDWSLETLGCPIYPQDRFQVGVALSVWERHGLGDGMVVERRGAANRWTGQRASSRYRGQEALQQLSGQFFFNAVPRRQGE